MEKYAVEKQKQSYNLIIHSKALKAITKDIKAFKIFTGSSVVVFLQFLR